MKNRKTRSAMRRMLFTLALVLVVAVASVGGTIAWLTDKTDPVMNTFTVGDINITLTETNTVAVDGKQTKQFKIIPGTNLEKDPVVTVEKGSEDCYLFVQVVEANWPTAKEADNTTLKVRYEIATGWTLVTGTTNVYYREVSANAASDQPFDVLKTLVNDTTNNKKYTVLVSENLTKEEAAQIGKNENAPTLTFKAYAIQKDNTGTAADAWAKLNPTSGN